MKIDIIHVTVFIDEIFYLLLYLSFQHDICNKYKNEITVCI